MDKRQAKAVQDAIAAQGGMIYPGQHLNLKPFLEEKPKIRVKFTYTRNSKPVSFQKLWREKNKAGFKNLSVKEYCNMLALLEMDERERL